MTDPHRSPLSVMLPKLETWTPLDDEDRAALVSLPYRTRSFAPGRYIVRQGDKAESSCLLLSGFAFRSRLVRDGGRQILAFHMRGDMVDLQNSLLGLADHNVQALTDIEIAMIPREAILEVAAARPRVARAMWHDTLVDGSINREWATNIGRRDATARLAHFLCEFALRLELAGLGELCNYELPMTQEQLGDCVGLTSVHVNRTLKALEASGLITRTVRTVRVGDWAKLAEVGDFNSAYLHVDLKGRSIDPPPRTEP